MTQEIKIYEFSRAFDNVHYSDNYNKWVSGGYASEKINRFNKPLPPDIIKAVTAGYFSLNDSYPPVNGEVALIGWDLGIYSLLAVANGQIDDGGRPTIGYRYFWLEKNTNDPEVDGLGTILYWWHLQSEKPQFDMEKARSQETPEVSLTDNVVTRETFKEEFEAAIASTVSERLVPYIKVVNQRDSWLQNYPEYIHCHYISYYLTLDSKRPIAWAWNVRRLIHPENFISIYSSTERDQPSVSRTQITSINAEAQQETIKKNPQNSDIEECLKDIEIRFTSQRNLEKTGKLNELLEYLCAPSEFQINQRLYKNSRIYRALLALIFPEETQVWLEEFFNSNLENSNFKITLSLHKQLFQAASQQNQRAYENLYTVVSMHISDLLFELTKVNEKQRSEKIKYLLSETWKLPFHKYVRNLEDILVSYIQTQERNLDYDNFHKYVLNTAEEIRTKIRNKDIFYYEDNRFEKLINLLKANEFGKLVSVLKFFSTKKLDSDSPDWLRNFLIPPNMKQKIPTNSHLIHNLFLTQFLNVIQSIILFPATLLFDTNQQNNNDDSKFLNPLFAGIVLIIASVGILYFLGNNYLLLSTVSLAFGALILLIGSFKFRGNDLYSKLFIVIIIITVGGYFYHLAYSKHLSPPRDSSSKNIVNFNNIKDFKAN